MGKYSLLIVFAVLLASALLASKGMETDQDTSEAQEERQEEVLARQIARSAFKMGLSELCRDYKGWRPTRTNVSYEGGTFDLEASGTDPVSLTAVGDFGSATWKISGQVYQEDRLGGWFGGITAKGDANFKVSGPGCSNKPCVSGLDFAGREDRRGISLPNSGSEPATCSDFDDKVKGKEKGCDVKSRHPNRDEWISTKIDELEGEITDEMQKKSSDVTVCSSCKIQGNATREGILYVTGKATISGDAQWNGLVYVAEGASVRINGGGGERNINGTMVMDEGATFDMAGGNRVQYNSDNLRKYIDQFDSMKRKVLTVKDRTEGLFRSWE